MGCVNHIYNITILLFGDLKKGNEGVYFSLEKGASWAQWGNEKNHSGRRQERKN
jgi:hypothetical protein